MFRGRLSGSEPSRRSILLPRTGANRSGAPGERRDEHGVRAMPVRPQPDALLGAVGPVDRRGNELRPMAEDRPAGGVGLGRGNVQTEYTSRPPGRSEFGAPRRRSRPGSRARRDRSSRAGRHSSSGRRRAAPMPEHGASTRIRSNGPLRRRASGVLGHHPDRGAQPAGQLGDQAGPGRVGVGRDQQAVVPHETGRVRGLAAGAGARVEDALARLAGRAPAPRTPTTRPGSRTIPPGTPAEPAGEPRPRGTCRDAARRGGRRTRLAAAPRARPRGWPRRCSSGWPAGPGSRAPSAARGELPGKDALELGDRPRRDAGPEATPTRGRRPAATRAGSAASARSTAFTKPRSPCRARRDGLADGRVRRDPREQHLVRAQPEQGQGPGRRPGRAGG